MKKSLRCFLNRYVRSLQCQLMVGNKKNKTLCVKDVKIFTLYLPNFIISRIVMIHSQSRLDYSWFIKDAKPCCLCENKLIESFHEQTFHPAQTYTTGSVHERKQIHFLLKIFGLNKQTKLAWTLLITWPALYNTVGCADWDPWCSTSVTATEANLIAAHSLLMKNTEITHFYITKLFNLLLIGMCYNSYNYKSNNYVSILFRIFVFLLI